MPNWEEVSSRILQGPVLGPVQFSISLNDLENGTGWTLSKSADETLLSEVTGSLEDLGHKDQVQKYKMGRDWIDFSIAEKNLVVIVNHTLNELTVKKLIAHYNVLTRLSYENHREWFFLSCQNRWGLT